MSTQAIEQFLQTAYTDEKLAALLAHCEDGKLAWASCCCFVGIPTATHALRTDLVNGAAGHYSLATTIVGAHEAEVEFFGLGDDSERRAKLLPIIRAEMKRRDSLATHNVTAREYGDNNVTKEECFVPALTN